VTAASQTQRRAWASRWADVHFFAPVAGFVSVVAIVSEALTAAPRYIAHRWPIDRKAMSVVDEAALQCGVVAIVTDASFARPAQARSGGGWANPETGACGMTRRFCLIARIPLDGIFGNDGKVDGWQALAAGPLISQLTLRPDQIASIDGVRRANHLFRPAPGVKARSK
jgi:hypothetical protein